MLHGERLIGPNPNRAIRITASAVAASTAATNPFPDRGGGWYLGCSLPQVFHPELTIALERIRGVNVANKSSNSRQSRVKMRDGRVPRF